MKNILMKNRFKNLFVMFAFVLLIAVTAAGGTAVHAASKVSDGTYNFSPCMVTKFQVKNNKLTLKVSKDDPTGIGKDGDANFKKYTLKVKVAKSCKYYWNEFIRGTGESSSGKSTYADVKSYIKGDRDYYLQSSYAGNVGLSSIKVKNGKVVKVVYFHM